MLTSDCSMRLDKSAMALDARRVCGYIMRYEASESSSVPCDDDMYIADFDGGSLPPFFMANFAFRFHLVACKAQRIHEISNCWDMHIQHEILLFLEAHPSPGQAFNVLPSARPLSV
jgi:hypothetical protein